MDDDDLGYSSFVSTPPSAAQFRQSVNRSNPRGATFGIDQPEPADGPIRRPLFKEYCTDQQVLSFMTHGRFTYLALCLRTDRGHRWYITGSGAWFGTNVLTVEQLSEVLMRPSTSHIRNLSIRSSLSPRFF